MPLSINYCSKSRLALLGLVLTMPLFVVGHRADAQKRQTGQPGTTRSVPNATDPQKKNLTRVNTSETSEGSSITIFSDMPLNDYSAYRGGNRFYVLIPSADASRIVSGLRGRGFADVRAQKRGNDVLLSFRLLAGATARVSQKFNRLEILITVPALVAANSTSTAGNSNVNTATQADPAGNVSNRGGGNNTTANRSGRGTSSRGRANPYGVTSPGETATSGFSQTDSNSNISTSPDAIPVGPDGQVIKSNASELTSQSSPIATPSTTPPADQIAQLQQAQELPGSGSQVPSSTTSAIPTGGSTFGAQLRQNWLFILLAVVVAGLVGWVVFARSRENRSPVERRIETIREWKATAGIIDAPLVEETTPLVAETTPLVAETTPLVAETTPLVEETSPRVAETTPLVSHPLEESRVDSFDAEDMVVPIVASAVVADAVQDDSAQEEIEEKEIEPARPVAIEQASENIARLLAGDAYDEAVISTEHSEARQMIAAELLGALAGRNLVRHERARRAFVTHGYFDDATRTLRTAESPGERASAARSLGLVRDDSGTPHLVAALEDPSPVVRRAAVESLAEIRDPLAVAPLEALRDREKNRKVPVALIQHAIEASVVGRMKVEPTPTLTPDEPLPAIAEDTVEPVDAELTAVVEALPVDSEPFSYVESESEPVVATEPLVTTEADSNVVDEATTVTEEFEAVQVAEPEAVDAEAETSTVEDVAGEMPEVVVAPVDTAGTEAATSDAWVDVDVSQDSEVADASVSPIALDQPVEETLVDESSIIDVAAEPAAEAVQAASEPEPETEEPSLLPSGTTDAVIAGAGSAVLTTAALEDDKGLDDALESEKEIAVAWATDKEIDVVAGDRAGVTEELLSRLASEDTAERVAAVEELGSIGGDGAFREISATFDDPSPDVRNAAARSLFILNPDRAASFTRALREASPERRRNIGGALSSSGLATEAIGHLMGESREITYDAFSLLFLMAKAGEVLPLMRAVEEHPNTEVRLAVVKLLALSGQQEILPAFRRLAVRGSLPTEVRSAVMEAIYQISSQTTGA